MKLLTYLIGVPGAGKSTVMARLILQAGCQTWPRKRPVEHLDCRDFIVLGGFEPPFPGTDRLSMAAQPLVLQWLTSPDFRWPHVAGEGDRLANVSFFEQLLTAPDWWAHLVFLRVTTAVAQRRRSDRALKHRLELQDTKWLAGRASKVDNLWNHFTGLFVHPRCTISVVDGNRSIEEVSEEIGNLVRDVSMLTAQTVASGIGPRKRSWQ